MYIYVTLVKEKWFQTFWDSSRILQNICGLVTMVLDLCIYTITMDLLGLLCSTLHWLASLFMMSYLEQCQGQITIVGP